MSDRNGEPPADAERAPGAGRCRIRAVVATAAAWALVFGASAMAVGAIGWAWRIFAACDLDMRMGFTEPTVAASLPWVAGEIVLAGLAAPLLVLSAEVSADRSGSETSAIRRVGLPRGIGVTDIRRCRASAVPLFLIGFALPFAMRRDIAPYWLAIGQLAALSTGVLSAALAMFAWTVRHDARVATAAAWVPLAALAIAGTWFFAVHMPDWRCVRWYPLASALIMETVLAIQLLASGASGIAFVLLAGACGRVR